MKTKFDISSCAFDTNEDYYEYYKKWFKGYGYEYSDVNTEEVYKIYDKEYNLKEGDRVLLSGVGICIIDWKCIDIDNDIIIYSVKEE